MFTTRIQKGGIIIIPKKILDRMHLKPGNLVELTTEDGNLIIIPARKTAQSKKKQIKRLIVQKVATNIFRVG